LKKLKIPKLVSLMRNSNSGIFLTFFQLFQPKINNANPKRNPKPKSYFDAFALPKNKAGKLPKSLRLNINSLHLGAVQIVAFFYGYHP
jgi:hypothetical protein